MLINFICCIFMFLFSLVGVAFLTLLERKILGYLQMRKGPDSVGISGVFQPFSDAVKLFTKQFVVPLKINFYPYWVSPIIGLLISLTVWVVFPYFYILISWKYSILFMLSILSLGVYSIMFSGWFSNSSYSILGCLRSIAQTISYEVSFFFMIACLVLFCGNLTFFWFYVFQKNGWFIFLSFPIFLMLFVSFLAELNRSPFDFSEGESELVSGFNIEYGGSGFAFIFLAEYLSILFASMLISLMFMGTTNMEFFFYLKLCSVGSLIILIRGVLPRYRYDKLMYLCWKVYLFCSLNFMLFYASMVLG